MQIRNMIEGDIPQLANLYQLFWGEPSDTEKMEQQFAVIKNKDTHILLSAVEHERLIGSVTGIICAELYGDCRPFLVIENMIVDQTKRRKGIASALLNELETIAGERECTLVTETDRTDACAFYEASGFLSGVNSGYKKKLR